ncbi:MAG: glycoside hydrolase family 99-like domain-containing protein [Burkholderiales bacterium]
MTRRNARVIAFYLPQFHPIPENDAWWSPGFTEWTNAARARPLFRGHYQPHMPADLGFYDLRLPETRAQQAELAARYGVEGFCYYHYWFGGRELLQRPLDEVLLSGEPDFPFCVCWANESWTGIWHGEPRRILMEQTYPPGDDERHFERLLPFFRDRRYLKVNDLPLMVVYKPLELPDPKQFCRRWKAMARDAGLDGLYLVGVKHNDRFLPEPAGFDAAILQKLAPKTGTVPWRYAALKIKSKLHRCRLTILDYKKVHLQSIRTESTSYKEFPCIIPNWDNTPRSGLNGLVLHGSTPELFRAQVKKAVAKVQRDLQGEEQIIFLKSWNEWAEGNHVEPDLKWGHAYLQVLAEELNSTPPEPHHD